MAIPAFFKETSEASKANRVDKVDSSTLADNVIEKFNPDKRIEYNNLDSVKDVPQIFNPDKRIEKNESNQDSTKPDSVKPSVEQSELKEKMKEGLEQYKQELIDNSPFPDTVNLDELKVDNIERLPKEEVAKRRDAFKRDKANLIKEWENQTGREWPRYKEDVIVNGVVVAKAGDLYDAHHIKPLSWGGENTASNITPMEWRPHHQKLHASDSGYSKVSNLIKNYGG